MTDEKVPVYLTRLEAESLRRYLSFGIGGMPTEREAAAVRRAHGRLNAALRRDEMRRKLPPLPGRLGKRLKVLAPPPARR